MRFHSVLSTVLLALVFAFPSSVYPEVLTPVQRAAIDAHALAAPPDVERDRKQLAAYLTQHLRTEPEKLRAIYRWLADRIEYDVEAYLAGTYMSGGSADVLTQRKSVCEGFASLFEELAREAGLKVKSISGYAKGYGMAAGQRFDKPNHMWTAVQIDGVWLMIDATWGAGYVANGKYVKALSEAYFLVPPEQFVFSHFPAEESWQLQRTPRLTQSEFEALPTVPSNLFGNAISPVAVWEAAKGSEFRGAFVQTFDLPYRLANVRKAPLTYHLQLDRIYQFAIEAQAFEKMAIVQADKWVEMEREADMFTASYQTQTTGHLWVMGKRPGTTDYTAILAYEMLP